MRNSKLAGLAGLCGVAALFGAAAPASAAPFSAQLGAYPRVWQGHCPKAILFSGSITSPGPATVHYRFVRSDGAMGPVMTLVFPTIGTKIVQTTWTLGTTGFTYSGWEKIVVISPVPVQSAEAQFSVLCGS